MFYMQKNRLVYLLVPHVCLIFLILFFTKNHDDGSMEVPQEKVSFESSFMDKESRYEDEMTQKVEHLLRGLGEREPVVTVHVVLDRNQVEREIFAPGESEKVVESIQKTEEDLQKPSLSLGDEDTLVSSEAERSTYLNKKESINYMVKQTKHKKVRTAPEIAKVSCVVAVSEKNANRLELLEKAVATALGMNFERGDMVLACTQTP